MKMENAGVFKTCSEQDWLNKLIQKWYQFVLTWSKFIKCNKIKCICSCSGRSNINKMYMMRNNIICAPNIMSILSSNSIPNTGYPFETSHFSCMLHVIIFQNNLNIQMKILVHVYIIIKLIYIERLFYAATLYSHWC